MARSTRITIIVENMDEITPTEIVTENPFIGPEPRK
jgi:hypothetical protein